MPHIILTEQQAEILSRASGPVEVRDNQGRTIASLTPLDPVEVEMVARSKQSLAVGGPRIPSDRVQAFLQKLHEIERQERIDDGKVEEVLRRVIAGEQP